MRTALLIVDLEGVAGVDSLEMLVAGSVSYPRACELLTRETLAAVRGLLDAGFDHVRISDSHRAGVMQPNVNGAALPEQASLHWDEDAYSEAMFDGVDSVACLGMHAPAASLGFAAHTVDIHCDWRAGTQRLSEASIVLGLAAEREIPAVFVSGDDRLGVTLRRSGVPFVQTKVSQSAAASVSRESAEVLRDIERAARSAPVGVRPLPPRPLSISFKSQWQTRCAQREIDCVAQDATTLVVQADSFRERYTLGHRATQASGATFARVVRGFPGLPSFEEDATGLLQRTFRRSRSLETQGRAARALKAFLQRTSDTSDVERADRALTLHMLRSHAPAFFAAQELEPHFRGALEALNAVPASFEPELSPADGMARLDALYLRHLHGLAGEPVDEQALGSYIQFGSFMNGRLWGWLMGELGARLGLEVRPGFAPRMLRATSRTDDLYWVTHLFLLATDYLLKPLRADDFAAETEELLLATPWLVQTKQVDLAAEVALCLQLSGESGSHEHGQLLRLVTAHQRRDGVVLDPSTAGDDDDQPRRIAHATAAALIAFAGPSTEADPSIVSPLEL